MSGLYQLSHFSASLECLVMILFLCSPEKVKHRSPSCCALCMCTQHIKGECSLLMVLLEEGAKDLWYQELGVQAWSLANRWCSQFVLLLPLEVHHCLGVWIICLMFRVLHPSCFSSRKDRKLFHTCDKSDGISSISVKGCGSSFLGKEENLRT